MTYELGKTYFISYWRQHCTVKALHTNYGWMGNAVTVEWEDGHTTTHCTPLGPKDKLIEGVEIHG